MQYCSRSSWLHRTRPRQGSSSNYKNRISDPRLLAYARSNRFERVWKLCRGTDNGKISRRNISFCSAVTHPESCGGNCWLCCYNTAHEIHLRQLPSVHLKLCNGIPPHVTCRAWDLIANQNITALPPMQCVWKLFSLMRQARIDKHMFEGQTHIEHTHCIP